MTNRVKRYDGVITLEQRQAISKRYKRITIRLNQRDKYEFEEVGSLREMNHEKKGTKRLRMIHE